MTVETLRDRKATPKEVEAARRFVLGYGGIGIVEAGRRLSMNAGYLSEILAGKRNRKLRLSEIRKLRGEAAA